VSSTLELRELLPVETPLGFGYAIIFESGEHDNHFTVILDTGALVTFTQDRIRVSRDYTHRRGVSDEEMRNIIKPLAEPAPCASSE
jgi:hypothetical protein